jgi:hypothetical protein
VQLQLKNAIALFYQKSATDELFSDDMGLKKFLVD